RQYNQRQRSFVNNIIHQEPPEQAVGECPRTSLYHEDRILITPDVVLNLFEMLLTFEYPVGRRMLLMILFGKRLDVLRHFLFFGIVYRRDKFELCYYRPILIEEVIESFFVQREPMTQRNNQPSREQVTQGI